MEERWKIVRIRFWPKGYAMVDEAMTFDEAFWVAADQRVQQARLALEQEPSPDERRKLVEVLLSAMRFGEAEEALAPLLAERPDIDAINALARVHAVHGRAEEFHAARARRSSAGIRALATYMRRGWCFALRIPDADNPESEAAVDPESEDPDSESYVDRDNRCDFEVIAEIQTDRGDLQGVGVVRTLHGFEASESIYLMQHYNGGWMRVLRISDGPFIGNQTEGVGEINVSDVALRERPTGASPQLQARFERMLLDDGDETPERGVLVCPLIEEAQCAFLPEQVVFDAFMRGRTSEYELAFTDDSVRVRRTSGPEQTNVREGLLELESLFAPVTAP